MLRAKSGRTVSGPALWILTPLLAFFIFELASRYHNPFPPFTTSLSSRQSELSDFGGVVLGLRRLGADIAWIQTLQYYGTPEPDQTEFEFENGLGKYPEFLAYCERVIRIDPYFTYAYFYGASVLGWNLNRLDEAETLLKEGVNRNPHEWRFQQYLAALAYQKNHDVEGLTAFLERFAPDPDCPNMLRAMLANIYKKDKRYEKSAQIWTMVLATKDPDYIRRAEYQLKILAYLSSQSRQPRLNLTTGK